MPEIEITESASDSTTHTYVVEVREGGTHTTHTVAVNDEYASQISGDKIGTKELVVKSFEFLLDREPKESILRSFDLSVIERYFPEYPNTITNYF